jgi:hypothetical protein
MIRHAKDEGSDKGLSWGGGNRGGESPIALSTSKPEPEKATDARRRRLAWFCHESYAVLEEKQELER